MAMEMVMPHKAHILLIAGSLLWLAACSQSPSDNAASSGKADSKAAQASAVSDKCKDFPVPIYPSHAKVFCETDSGNPLVQTGSSKPLHQTAFIESADSVEKVEGYYKTQVQAAGWTAEPGDNNTPQHASVKMTKGKGYATAVINVGMDKVGSRTQIHAYPNGNE
jgi:hypothetical protein